jgi:glucose/mannose-6-phosphate isomerase
MTTKNIDKSNMRKVILDFPKQFEQGLKLAKNVGVKGKFENIIICGMGGSALPANILICWLNELISKSSLSIPPIYIHRDYNLPRLAGKKSLIICISYSGNTEETVSVLRQTIKRKLNVVAITTGGKIEKLSKKYNIPWVKIPFGIQPRSATGYIFTSLVKILSNSKIIENKSKEILQLAKDLKKLDQEKKGREIAKKLANKIPLIYASNKFKCLARIWKIKFNENSKIPAFFNYFPELNHNEMAGFTQINKKNNYFYIIILRDKNDCLRNLKRMELFANLVKTKRINVDFINIKEGGILFKIFSTLVLGDWISYYLALEYKIDPAPVKIVEEFKKKLNE